GIDHDAFVILLGAQNNTEQRKGFYNVIDTLAKLRKIPAAEGLVAGDKIILCAFGHNSDWLAATGFPNRQLGPVSQNEELALAYAAADIFLLPSLEDNQPNVMLEAMACGTPTVGFAVGGIAEVIVDGVNGRLAEPFDCAAMAEIVATLSQDNDQ